MKNMFTVLGANGFIGGYLCRELVSLGGRVNAFDRVINNKMLSDLTSKITFYQGDLSDYRLLEDAIKNTDVLFHLACTTTPATSDRDMVYDLSSNLISTIEVLNLCVRHNIKKVIFPSSGGAIYGINNNMPITEEANTEPITSYGAIKITIENYLHIFERKYGLKYISLRLANPYGPKYNNFTQGVIPAFIYNILKGKKLQVWGDGEVVRDYIYISDVISAFIKAINYDGKERVFNIGSGTGLSINQIISIIEKQTGKKCKIEYLEPRQCDIPYICLDIKKAKRYLAWVPEVSIEDGIRKTYEYMKQYYIN